MKCSGIWQNILERNHFFDKSIKDKHMLDLCSGWGRLIFNVALKGRYKFKSYTGVDISIQNALKFYDYQNNLIKSRCDVNVHLFVENILDFKPTEAKYSLITCCWCLGFFEKLQAM